MTRSLFVAGLNHKCIYNCVVVSHVQLGHKNAPSDKILAVGVKCEGCHGHDTATRVQKDVASPVGAKDFHIVAHKPIQNFEGPRNGDDAHEGLHFGRLKPKVVLVESEQAEIQKQFEALGKITDG